jgi:hypothetical protein
MTASLVFIGASFLHAACRFLAPAAAKIAPQTPPPARREVFAAFTIASVFCFVMSAWITLNGIVVHPFLTKKDLHKQIF